LGFKAGVVVKNKVIVEIKSIEAINNVHPKQALKYLKPGLLINFNEVL